MVAGNPTPVVFIHGLWLHASCWAPWIERFSSAGYAATAPGWPGESPDIAICRAHPERVADQGIEAVTAHFRAIVDASAQPPVLIGHSFGGLIVQKLLGEGRGCAAIAIDPAQIKGVLILPLAQLRSALPVLGNPLNIHRAVALTREEFRYGFGNAISEAASSALYDRYQVPSPARPLFEAATANLLPHSPAAVDVANATRGPLLMVSGTADHTVPDASTRASFRRYAHSPAVTELRTFEGRGHSLTIDDGWPDVAEACLRWLDDQDIRSLSAT
jgi:alpha-beta hydrolase superfamily lysophospholipase